MNQTTVSQLIEEGALSLTQEQIDQFKKKHLKRVTKKLVNTSNRGADDLLHLAKFLIRVVNEYETFCSKRNAPLIAKKAIFALIYFVAENDIIPDSDKEFGLSDDLIIARTVLKNHQDDLRDFADACSFSWEKLKGDYPDDFWNQ
ncbi:MAG: YkvA family protein [Verrucomicrobiota bacterium]